MASLDFKSLNSDVLWLASAFLLAGIQKLWHGYQERRADTWPITYGRIDRVTFDTEQKKVRLKCYYTYKVGGESFVGSFRKTFEDPDEAARWQDALQKKQVAVRYDPEHPSRSQLRESDLQPIVESAAPRIQLHPTNQSSGVKVFAAKVCAVLCGLGLAITGAVLMEQYIGRELVPRGVSSIAGWAALPVFFLGLWIGGKDKLAARIPSWMKYLGYALLYYALFSSFLGQGRHRGRSQNWVDARYQLFLYFSALEFCYLRLQQRDDAPQPDYGALTGSSLK